MKHRVLIADDEEHARSGLASLVSNWGYEVAEAADGKEALERASDFHPSVVVADVIMPGLDGVALLMQAFGHPMHFCCKLLQFPRPSGR